MSEEPTRVRIKRAIIEALELEGMTPDDIADDQTLFGDEEGALGLDSVDALELMVVFEKDFGVAIDNEEVDVEAFSTVVKLEEFLNQLRSEAAGSG